MQYIHVTCRSAPNIQECQSDAINAAQCPPAPLPSTTCDPSCQTPPTYTSAPALTSTHRSAGRHAPSLRRTHQHSRSHSRTPRAPMASTRTSSSSSTASVRPSDFLFVVLSSRLDVNMIVGSDRSRFRRYAWPIRESRACAQSPADGYPRALRLFAVSATPPSRSIPFEFSPSISLDFPSSTLPGSSGTPPSQRSPSLTHKRIRRQPSTSSLSSSPTSLPSANGLQIECTCLGSRRVGVLLSRP